MLSKIDKNFLIVLVLFIIIFLFLPILVYVLIYFDVEFLFTTFFPFVVISYIFIVPVLFIMLIVNLIFKVVTKNKNKKDLIIIFLNLISIFFFGYIYFSTVFAVKFL